MPIALLVLVPLTHTVDPRLDEPMRLLTEVCFHDTRATLEHDCLTYHDQMIASGSAGGVASTRTKIEAESGTLEGDNRASPVPALRDTRVGASDEWCLG
jgi:hypothetical protein